MCLRETSQTTCIQSKVSFNEMSIMNMNASLSEIGHSSRSINRCNLMEYSNVFWDFLYTRSPVGVPSNWLYPSSNPMFVL